MKKIKYTPDAADKLRAIKFAISEKYGSKKANEIVGQITHSIRDLTNNENRGPSAEAMFGIPTNYRYLYVSKNYVFYDLEDEYIRIINIYNEKEDFMWLLFGVETTSQETIDYWNE